MNPADAIVQRSRNSQRVAQSPSELLAVESPPGDLPLLAASFAIRNYRDNGNPVAVKREIAWIVADVDLLDGEPMTLRERLEQGHSIIAKGTVWLRVEPKARHWT